MSFGKRKPASTADKSNQPTRVFPEQYWKGKSGEILRSWGMSPDDPSNIVLTNDDIAARHIKWQAEALAFLDKVNSNAPGGTKLGLFFCIPPQCWEGRHYRFLNFALELSPYDTWNMLLLPTDNKSAFILGFTQHPGGIDPKHIEKSNDFILELEERFNKVHQYVLSAAQAGDYEQIGLFIEKKRESIGQLGGLASVFGNMIAGKETYTKSRKMFFGL